MVVQILVVFVLFALVMTGMAVGVIAGRSGIRRSCSGGRNSPGAAACVCEGRAHRCRMILRPPPSQASVGGRAAAGDLIEAG